MGIALAPLHLAARKNDRLRVSGMQLDPSRGNTMVPVGDEDSPKSGSLGRSAVPRRKPKVSLIVVLPENHVVSPDRIAEGQRAHGDQQVDVVIACAGEPANLAAARQSFGDAQFLLAPAGTTTEDLRELAMRQAPGDIVTLLSGDPAPESCANARAS
jgi:hypothetical protein